MLGINEIRKLAIVIKSGPMTAEIKLYYSWLISPKNVRIFLLLSM